MLSHPLSHAGSKNIYIDIDHTIIKYHQFPMTNGKLARMTNRKAQANQHIAKKRHTQGFTEGLAEAAAVVLQYILSALPSPDES